MTNEGRKSVMSECSCQRLTTVVVGSTATVRCKKRRRRREERIGGSGEELTESAKFGDHRAISRPVQPNSDMDRDKDWCAMRRHAMLISYSLINLTLQRPARLLKPAPTLHSAQQARFMRRHFIRYIMILMLGQS